MRYARLSGDLDKFLEREAKALAKKNADLGISTETNLKKKERHAQLTLNVKLDEQLEKQNGRLKNNLMENY